MKKSVVKFHLVVFVSLSIATIFSLMWDVKGVTGREDFQNAEITTAQEIQLSPSEQQQSSGSEVTASVSSLPQRQPASLSLSTERQASQLFDISSYCLQDQILNSEKSQNINREFVQLQGLRSCQSQEITEIVNETNGYSASLLNLNEKMFKTDLLRLQKGENKIAIRFKDKKLNNKVSIIKVLAHF